MRKTKGKLIISGLCLAVTLAFSGGMTTYARQERIQVPEDKNSGEVTFDAQYYAKAYPKVAKKVGNNPKALYDHYVKYGQAEGKTPYPVLSNISAYTTTPTDMKMYAGQWAFTFEKLQNGMAGLELPIGAEYHVVGITSNGYYLTETIGGRNNAYKYYRYVPVADLYPTQAEAMATYIPTQEEIRELQYLQTYGDGSDLAFTGTYTLPNSKIEMPRLNKFNTAGLDPDNDWWFGKIMTAWGKANSDNITVNMKKFTNGLDDMEWRTIPESSRGANDIDGFWNDIAASYWCASGATPAVSMGAYDFALFRPGYWEDEGYYKLIIKSPLDYDAAIKLEYSFYDKEMIWACQDALAVMLSLVSTTPVELQKAILDAIYYCPDDRELPITTDFQWCYIGDCRIKLVGWDYTSDNYAGSWDKMQHHYSIYHIAPLENLGSLKQN